jgi:uncharacterized protein (DUF1697 family)
MPKYIALIRGINVGGHNLLTMSDLRDLLESLKFDEVKSLLQSGNLLFNARRRSSAELERLLETETTKRLNATVDFFVRTSAELETIIGHNPFPKEAENDPGHLLVLCLKKEPGPRTVGALQAAIQGREVVRRDGKQLYIVYPDGIGRSKLTNALLEKKLGTRVTGRNWNTIVKLAALAKKAED